MLAPVGVSTAYLLSGRCVMVPPDRLVKMTPEDAKPMQAQGWTLSEG